MNLRRNPILPILIVTLLAILLAYAPAEARGKPHKSRKSFVEQLKPGEVEALRKKLPNWDKLDRRKQEGIAKGVVKWRNATPEQRAKAEQRMLELKERGKGGRRFRAEKMRFAQGVGEAIWKQLPEAVHDEIKKRRIRPAMAKMVLFHMWNGKIAALEGLAFKPDDIQAFPEKLRERVRNHAAVLADPAADEKSKRGALHGLGHMRAHLRIEALKNNLVPEGGNGAVSVEQFAAALRKTWPEAFDGLVRDVAEKPERFAQGIARRAHRGGSGMDRSGRLSKYEFVQIVRQLERAARQNWKGRPDLKKAAERVIQGILIQDLKVDAAIVRSLPPFAQAKEREKALRGLLGRLFKRGEGRHKPK